MVRKRECPPGDGFRDGRGVSRNQGENVGTIAAARTDRNAATGIKATIADDLGRGDTEPTFERLKDGARPCESQPEVIVNENDSAGLIDEILELSKTDCGAPLEADNLEKLSELQRCRPAEWERIRARLSKETEVRIGELDKALAKWARVDDGEGLQGRPLEWAKVEPWHEPVNGANLLSEIADLIRRYVEMPDASTDAVALWIESTWLHGRLELSTFLNVTSATKRCGKSLLMEVIGELVFRPLPVSGSITPAALFRTIERHGPTLLLDEADTYLTKSPELRGIVNGSQRHDGAYIIRTVGDDHEPRRFGTWCPKAIAGIGRLPDTVLDRSVIVRLERRAPNSANLPRWRDRDRQETKALRRKSSRWTAENAEAILRQRGTVNFPPGLNDRACDAWEALLAIGDVAGGRWAEISGRAWRACKEIAADAKEETGINEILLRDIRLVFRDAGDPNHLPTCQVGEPDDKSVPAILPALIALEGQPWSEYRIGRPLSPHELSKLLKPFGISSRTIRLGALTPKGYKRTAFEPVWKRYGIGDSEAT